MTIGQEFVLKTPVRIVEQNFSNNTRYGFQKRYIVELERYVPSDDYGNEDKDEDPYIIIERVPDDDRDGCPVWVRPTIG